MTDKTDMEEVSILHQQGLLAMQMFKGEIPFPDELEIPLELHEHVMGFVVKFVNIIELLEAERQRADELQETVNRLSKESNRLFDDRQRLNKSWTEAETDNALLRDELAALRGEQEPVENPVLGYADSYRAIARQGSDSVPIWGVITDLERNIAPLFTNSPKPVVLPGIGGVESTSAPEFVNYADGWRDAINECRKSLRAAGIVVKGGE